MNFKVGDRVHYHPIIGDAHDGKVYTITYIGDIPSRKNVAWLKGKPGCVATEALSHADETLHTDKSEAALIEGGLA